MKRSIIISFILLVLLAACSPNGSGAECKQGICVSLEVLGPIQAMEPAPFIITVKTDKDVTGLGISISGDATVSIIDIEKKPDGAKLGYQDKTSLSWLIDTKGGVEYSFSGHVAFPKPTVSYGVFNYGLIVAAGNPSITRVTDSVTIYMDSSGKQVEEGTAKSAMQTDFPAPTPPPDLTIVPVTPFPTVTWPTETPFPSPTQTQPAYPAPGKQISTEGANQKQPLPSPTQAAYPNP